MSHIDDLREVIHKLYGAKATHVESIPVKESFQGKRFGTALSRFSTFTTIPKLIVFTHGRTKQTKAAKGM